MKTITAVVAAAAFSTVAHADFVDVQYKGTAKGISVRVQDPVGARNLFAGQLKHQLSNGTGVASTLSGVHRTFCSDLYQTVTSTTKTYSLVTIDQIPGAAPMGNVKAAAIQAIYNAFGVAASDVNADSKLAGAFQLAVWEIVTDFNGTLGSLSMTNGGFKATKTDGSALDATVSSHLNAMFSTAVNLATTGVSLTGLASGKAQDQILMGFAVPAPGTAALAALGTLMIARRRRQA
jgi:hypothetical protein